MSGSKSRLSSSEVNPSTLASGVRSSCETMFTSSVFIRSLSRSSSFCACSSSLPSSQPLRHRVEGVRQVADLAWAVLGQAVLELAGREATGAGGDCTDRSADRLGQHDAEENDQRRRGPDCDDPDDDGDLRASPGHPRRLRGELVLRAPELAEQLPDLIGVDLPTLCEGALLGDARGFLQVRDQQRHELVDVLPDPLRQCVGARPLAGIVGRKRLERGEARLQVVPGRAVAAQESARLIRALRQADAEEARLDVGYELLELQRRRRHVLRPRLALGRVALRRDGDDERRKRRGDQQREQLARQPHATRQGHASSSSTAVLRSSGSNGLETKRSAPAVHASTSAWLQAVMTTTGVVRQLRVGAQFIEHLDPTQPGHHHVEHDQIRTEVASNGEHLAPVGGLDEPVARPQDGADELAKARVIVPDEDGRLGSVGFGLSLCALHGAAGGGDGAQPERRDWGPRHRAGSQNPRTLECSQPVSRRLRRECGLQRPAQLRRARGDDS